MKNQKGITLVALIITIIVMLILVAVSVAVVINSGILGTAKSAGDSTEAAYDEDANIGEVVNIDNTMVNMNNTNEIINALSGT